MESNSRHGQDFQPGKASPFTKQEFTPKIFQVSTVDANAKGFAHVMRPGTASDRTFTKQFPTRVFGGFKGGNRLMTAIQRHPYRGAKYQLNPRMFVDRRPNRRQYAQPFTAQVWGKQYPQADKLYQDGKSRQLPVDWRVGHSQLDRQDDLPQDTLRMEQIEEVLNKNQ